MYLKAEETYRRNVPVEMLFPGGKRKALTLSYDDGTIHDRPLLALLNRYGVKGTFNLNAGLFGRKERLLLDGFDTDFSRVEADEVKELYAGHEVASHTLTHPALTGLPVNLASAEVLKDRESLEELTGELVTGFAYPYGAYDEEAKRVLRSCGIAYARTVESTGGFAIPGDFLAWHPTCHHGDPRLMELLQEFLSEERQWGPRLFYLWGHSYEFAQRNNWQVMEKFLSAASEQKELVWFASNGELAAYIKAFRGLQRSVDGRLVSNPSGLMLWLLADGQIRQIQGNETIALY